MQWEPIETAPRDSKRLLYLARFNEAGEMCELDFNGSWEYWEESWELAHINGWCWTSANGIEEPTHWAYQDAGAPPAMHSELMTRVREIIAAHDGLRAAARHLQCDPAYLMRLRDGKKTNPSGDMLKRLGLKKDVSFIRILE
jgi:hypothetical protein